MPETDPQDPLPEASFKWRRALVFGSAVAVGVFIWWRAPTLTPADTLVLIGWLLLVVVLDRVSYFGGASAEELIKLIATFRLMRGDKPKEGGE